MKRRKLKKFGAFGMPAHVVRITLGHEDKDTQAERITQRELDRAADEVLKKFPGLSVFAGRGRYRYSRGPNEGKMANEATTAFDIIATRSDHPSCKKLKKDMTGLAKKLARQWNQESAMLTLWCADGPVDVSWPMPRYRKWTRQKRESPRKRGSGA